VVVQIRQGDAGVITISTDTYIKGLMPGTSEVRVIDGLAVLNHRSVNGIRATLYATECSDDSIKFEPVFVVPVPETNHSLLNYRVRRQEDGSLRHEWSLLENDLWITTMYLITTVRSKG